MEAFWSKDESPWYARTLEFASRHLRDSEPAADAWRNAGAFGLLGLMAPEALGGSGLDATASVQVMEALGQGCTSLGLPFAFAAHAFACVVPVMEFAEPELRDSAVPKLATGEWVGANAITESGAGSDVYALRAKATRDGDDYLIDGVKSYVTNGTIADVAVVYARSGAADGYLGISAFLVNLHTAGVHIGPPLRKVGLERATICSISFESCRVPARYRLGAEGQGAAIFERSMGWERACLFGIYVGAMQRQLDSCVARANERIQGDAPIASYQAISHRIADMKLRLEASRLLLRRACWLMSRGQSNVIDIALAKLAVSEAAVQSGLDTMQIFGGDAMMLETGVSVGLFDALPSRIFSGTSEIQRNVIASELGLREPRRRLKR
ncbi:MAG TPA: acyl-CoA dehydrogenase family protein [Polyangiaceae bacterium]|jgi:alkylation response protein AidB-like acyl-CoA dehydrogenase|nr:acyl-CoA dehydrogenase family protein [Polyangiaceae bacterium]